MGDHTALLQQLIFSSHSCNEELMMGNPNSRTLPAVNLNTTECSHSLRISER